MKTNHVRNFKDSRGRFRRGKSFVEIALSGVAISTNVDSSDVSPQGLGW
jgi:hypothetical protein